MTNSAKITALYERLSRDDEQQGESNSIINQNRSSHIRHFTDDGISGTTFEREGFQKLIAEVEAGNVSTVIVKDMSRLGRNYLKVGFYTDIMFPEKGVRFIAVNNGVDSETMGDNDFTPFLNIRTEGTQRFGQSSKPKCRRGNVFPQAFPMVICVTRRISST